ncbi:MAG TPA: hypothetical protein ENK66_01740 [Arcobacter sp.]|nr:hypothetical protein [Arcobacter sp.]
MKGNYASTLKEIYKYECDFYNFMTHLAKEDDIPLSCISETSNSIFLWGDSHGRSISYGLNKIIENKYSHLKLSQVNTSGCWPVIGQTSFAKGEIKKACDRSNLYAINAIKRLKPKVVILVQRFKHENNQLFETAKHLIGMGVKNVLVVGPLPQWANDLPRIIAWKHWQNDSMKINDKDFKTEVLNSDQILQKRFLENNYKNIYYASPIQILCESTSNCTAILDEDMTPLSFDYGHLTKEGSVYVGENVLAPLLDRILSERETD